MIATTISATPAITIIDHWCCYLPACFHKNHIIYHFCCFHCPSCHFQHYQAASSVPCQHQLGVGGGLEVPGKDFLETGGSLTLTCWSTNQQLVVVVLHGCKFKKQAQKEYHVLHSCLLRPQQIQGGHQVQENKEFSLRSNKRNEYVSEHEPCKQIHITGKLRAKDKD